MRRRAGLAEHPFGTLKCRAGYRHFLVRGFNKVRGEWSLMALCYNFMRVLNIIGFDNFTAYLVRMANRRFASSLCPSRPAQNFPGRNIGRNHRQTRNHSAPLPPVSVNSHSCPASPLNPATVHAAFICACSHRTPSPRYPSHRSFLPPACRNCASRDAHAGRRRPSHD